MESLGASRAWSGLILVVIRTKLVTMPGSSVAPPPTAIRTDKPLSSPNYLLNESDISLLAILEPPSILGSANTNLPHQTSI